MRETLKFTAALLLAAITPTASIAYDVCDEQCIVRIDLLKFFSALNSSDKTALATRMVPDGMIFVHNRMDPEKPRVDVVPVNDHLQRWEKSDAVVEEVMITDRLLVDGDMAQVWGPYYFTVAGKLSHCGINSLSMVKTEDGWKVANTSFTMDPPEKCADVVARIDEAMELDP